MNNTENLLSQYDDIQKNVEFIRRIFLEIEMEVKRNIEIIKNSASEEECLRSLKNIDKLFKLVNVLNFDFINANFYLKNLESELDYDEVYFSIKERIGRIKTGELG